MKYAHSLVPFCAVLGVLLVPACSRHAGLGANNGRSVAAYADGSWVVTGRFEAVKVFGDGEVSGESGEDGDEETVLKSGGNMDAFVARYRVDGSLAWVAHAGGPLTDYGQDVAALPDGGALVTGQFEGEARFGTWEENDTTLTSAGGVDFFLAQYRPDGTLAWARGFGGAGADWGKGVAAFEDHSIVVVGRFESRATFGPGGGAETVLACVGKRDAFVARLQPDGQLLWARRLGGSGFDQAEDVVALADGSCLVTGSFEKEATFADGTASVLASDGDKDVFVAHLDAEGALLWARSAGGPKDDNSRGIAAFPDGACVVTGRFDDHALFGRGEAGETRLADAGKRDIFVARYDAAQFGAGEPGATVLNSSGGLDLFVARWGRAGELLWARAAGGVGPERGYGIASLPGGATVVAGGQPLDGRRDEDDLFVVRYDARGSSER